MSGCFFSETRCICSLSVSSMFATYLANELAKLLFKIWWHHHPLVRRRHREASKGRSVAPRWPRRMAILQRSAGGVLSLSSFSYSLVKTSRMWPWHFWTVQCQCTQHRQPSSVTPTRDLTCHQQAGKCTALLCVVRRF